MLGALFARRLTQAHVITLIAEVAAVVDEKTMGG
jgi:hypothetical protein